MMSGPFSLDNATYIFGSFYHSSPLGLVEKTPGDCVWQMIRHLSKHNADSHSTNDWLNSDDFPISYFTASWVAQFVSVFLTHPSNVYWNLFCHLLLATVPLLLPKACVPHLLLLAYFHVLLLSPHLLLLSWL